MKPTSSLFMPIGILLILLSVTIASQSQADESGVAKKRAAPKDKTSVAKADAKPQSFQLSNANVVQRKETYKKIGDVTLDMEIFEPKDKDPSKKYPAIVFFFGGGWNGGSAGGHVAAAIATTAGFEEKSDDLTVSFMPNALILFNPVFDNGPKGYGYDRVKEIFPAISPLHNLRPGTPPTIVFLGTKDNLIPVATAEDYKAQMLKNGDRSELFLYKDQPHGFFNYREATKHFYYRTIFEADKFLASLGWLDGEPKITSESMKLE